MDPQTIALAATFTFVLIVSAAWFILQYSQASAERRRQLAEELVKAAEQMLKGQPGQDKLSYVLSALQQKYPRLPVNALRHLVEAAVYDVKRSGRIGEIDLDVTDQQPDANARWN